jgi:hypothetical protein
VKLPAVAIAVAFAGGIALGLCGALAGSAASHVFLAGDLIMAACLISTGIVLTGFQKLVPGTALSMLSWALLGVVSAGIAQQPLPGDHVVSLMNEGRLELRSPLRWHGTLRDEPTHLPWGFGYEIDLSSVDIAGVPTPAFGGLRLSYVPRAGEQTIADLRAGDEVAVTAQARRPQVFHDAGGSTGARTSQRKESI